MSKVENTSDLCDCDCHDYSKKAIVHSIPCCRRCPDCNRGIKERAYDKHAAGCRYQSLVIYITKDST